MCWKTLSAQTALQGNTPGLLIHNVPCAQCTALLLPLAVFLSTSASATLVFPAALFRRAARVRQVSSKPPMARAHVLRAHRGNFQTYMEHRLAFYARAAVPDKKTRAAMVREKEIAESAQLALTKQLLEAKCAKCALKVL